MLDPQASESPNSMQQKAKQHKTKSQKTIA